MNRYYVESACLNPMIEEEWEVEAGFESQTEAENYIERSLRERDGIIFRITGACMTCGRSKADTICSDFFHVEGGI